jgi:hypothetical protein
MQSYIKKVLHFTSIFGISNLKVLCLVAATLVALTIGTLTITPAFAAGTGCLPQPLHGATVCIIVGNGYVRGQAKHDNGYFKTVTLYVMQCRADITYCVKIAANSGTNTSNILTSSKSAAYGHVYHACASWTDNRNYHYVNVCSPWRSWP